LIFMPNVYVVDDDDGVRDALEVLLTAYGYTVRGFARGLEFLDEAPSLAGGCAIVDVHMPGIDGIALQRRLSELNLKLPVIVMTGQGDVQTAVNAMKAGAVDFVEKPVARAAILAGIEQALHRFVEPPPADRAHTVVDGRLRLLSPRERQVLEGIVKGQPNKVIAQNLLLSPRTVEIHRARVMDKMQAQNLSELIRLALAAGLGPETA
jgi:two-component system response regulator FixJ